MDQPSLLVSSGDFLEGLDPESYNSLVGGDVAWASPELGLERGKKRSRDSAATGEVKADGSGDNGQGFMGESKPTAGGAKTKASREKARRERINERFSELARLCDPDEPKVDKSSILMDAIKLVKQQRMEIDQQKQLNKFLQERVSHYEKERSQLLCQQGMLLQVPMQVPTGILGAATNISAFNSMLPTFHGDQVSVPASAQQHQRIPKNGLSSYCMDLGSELNSSTAVGVPAGDSKAGILPDMPLTSEMGAGWAHPQTMDNSQDHLLRPPAA